MSKLNGPFTVEPCLDYEIKDADGEVVCEVSNHDEVAGEARRKADMVCAALNAVYYIGIAKGDAE